MSEREGPDRVAIIRDWWRQHIEPRDDGDADRGRRSSARALSARLRRAGTVEALVQPEVHALSRNLGFGHGAADRLAGLARVLAHVRAHDSHTLAARMSGDAAGDLRFQRLVRATPEELPDLVIRVLPMIENACHVGWLGRDLLDWSDRTRARWCFDYFDERQDIGSGEDKT